MKKKLMTILGIVELINAIGWTFTILAGVKRHKNLEPHSVRSYGVFGVRLVSCDKDEVVWFPTKQDIERLGRAE